MGWSHHSKVDCFTVSKSPHSSSTEFRPLWARASDECGHEPRPVLMEAGPNHQQAVAQRSTWGRKSITYTARMVLREKRGSQESLNPRCGHAAEPEGSPHAASPTAR